MAYRKNDTRKIAVIILKIAVIILKIAVIILKFKQCGSTIE